MKKLQKNDYGRNKISSDMNSFQIWKENLFWIFVGTPKKAGRSLQSYNLGKSYWNECSLVIPFIPSVLDSEASGLIVSMTNFHCAKNLITYCGSVSILPGSRSSIKECCRK